MLYIILWETSGYIFIEIIFFKLFIEIFSFQLAKSAADLAEGKQGITTVMDNFCRRTIPYFPVPWHSMEPVFSSFLMHDNLPTVL